MLGDPLIWINVTFPSVVVIDDMKRASDIRVLVVWYSWVAVLVGALTYFIFG